MTYDALVLRQAFDSLLDTPGRHVIRACVEAFRDPVHSLVIVDHSISSNSRLICRKIVYRVSLNDCGIPFDFRLIADSSFCRAVKVKEIARY